jgi:hypothetical protein
MSTHATSQLVILVNATPVLEYDRSKVLSEAQLESFKQMELKLDSGIELHGQKIHQPSKEQRVEFMSANLISAVLNDEEVLAAVSCAYIANALPDLKQIKAFENEGEISIELIFDREYQPESKLAFTPLNKIVSKPN